jgi:hypothetical protein
MLFCRYCTANCVSVVTVGLPQATVAVIGSAIATVTITVAHFVTIVFIVASRERFSVDLLISRSDVK